MTPILQYGAIPVFVMNNTFRVGIYHGMVDEMIDYMVEMIVEAVNGQG